MAKDSRYRPGMSRQNWSESEIQATVADYFGMLRKELAGEPYNKAEHRRRLIRLLDGRSESAVEMKHQNISAILLEEQLDAIDGYKPFGNYQRALRNAVLSNLRADSEIVDLLRAAEVALSPVELASSRTLTEVEAATPSLARKSKGDVPDSDWRLRARIYDFELRDHQARSVGRAGEELVCGFEKARLTSAGRPDLAKRVEWVSDSMGDGTGFDVLSWDDSEKELFIEVKSTNLSRYQPFLISRSEVAFSSAHADQFSLYRVFHLSQEPKLFRRPGSVLANFRLEPAVYEGRL